MDRKNIAREIRWLSVADGLPPYGRDVLVYAPDLVTQAHRGSTDAEGEHWAAANDGNEVEDVTHWAELPAPPVEKEKT